MAAQSKETYRHALAVSATRPGLDGTPYLYTLNLSCRQDMWDDLQPLFQQAVEGYRLLPTGNDFISPDKVTAAVRWVRGAGCSVDRSAGCRVQGRAAFCSARCRVQVAGSGSHPTGSTHAACLPNACPCLMPLLVCGPGACTDAVWPMAQGAAHE